MKLNEQVVRSSAERAPVTPGPSPADRGVEAMLDVIAGAQRERAPRPAPPPPAPPPPEPARLADRTANMARGGAVPSATEVERVLGANDLVDEFYLERALVAARPVCRLVARNPAGREVGYATGFMVSPQLLLTNWHVFETAAHATNAVADFDFRLDFKGNPAPAVRFLLRPDRFFTASRPLDYALVAVEPRSLDGAVALATFGFHRLIPATGKIWEGEWITIIQHPGGQRRQFAIRENQLVEKQPLFLWYMSDTAQGSSGAPAFNDSLQVVALHHSGRARRDGGLYVLRDGRRVPSLDGVDDSEVLWEKNEGVRVSVICADIASRLPAADPHVRELLAVIAGRQGDVMSNALARGAGLPVARPVLPFEAAAPDGPLAAAGASGTIVVPLQLHVTLAWGGPPPALAPAIPALGADGAVPLEAPALEKLVHPVHDPDYGNRRGYDDDFLGARVPLPEVTDLDVVSRLGNGRHVIPYEHFSVVVHRARRLALFTASNVDGRPQSRRPEPGDYSRRGLTGLAENDREKWLTDPRIPAQDQLPDLFYNQDRTAFDKGHLVRREDVCWGRTRRQIVRANGDTYHTTNCSPQVAAFNQSSRDGRWGQLENHVLAHVKNDRYTLFAGPVLDDADREFEGRDEHGAVAIKIPSRYWKVVVARRDGQLEAFAFVLTQDLKEVRFEAEEFRVDEEWTPYMTSLADLEAALRWVRFPDVVRQADQYGTAAGDEVLDAAGIEALGESRRRPGRR